MTNPLSDRGWSDKDYARAVGTLMGEAWGGAKNPASSLEDYELLADVIANRKESSHPSYRGKSIDKLLRSPQEFSTWSKGQKNARAMATKGMAAVLGKREDKLTGVAKQKHDLAVKALDNVFGNQSRRGVAKGADRYNNPKAGPSSFHDKPAREFGSVTAGMHRATGPNFDKNAGPAPYSQYGEFGTPREAIPPEARAPYSPSGLNIGPDFTSPPSQARGAVTDPYGFSNINTAAEAAPGSFAGYGPGAFGIEAPAPDYSDITAGMYEQPAAPAPMSNEDFNAIFGNMPEAEATGSVRNAQMSAAPAGFAPAINAPQVGGPYSFSQMVSGRPAPDAATIPNDVTGYGPGGAFGSRAPSPAFDFADIVNSTQWSGAAPANAPAQGAQVAQGPVAQPAESSSAFNARMSDALSPGLTGGMSPFQGTPLGVGAGIIDQGPFSTPIGPNPNPTSFSPANLGISTQAPSRGVVDYTEKTITKDVPNPAWSDWSRDYATKNAAQDAWLAADEDKLGVSRAPAALAFSPPPPPEPPRTVPQTTTVRSPVYGDIPAASVPAVNARPAAGSAVQAPAVAAPAVGGWWDSVKAGLGNVFGGGGLNLAGLGDYSGYGNFGGGYDTSGGYGGYGGTAPGDAGYGSDARSGSSNMGAGNLYS